MSTNELALPEGLTIKGRKPRLVLTTGTNHVIDDGEAKRGRLCGDGQWKDYYEVLTADVCSWPTPEAAAEFVYLHADLPYGWSVVTVQGNVALPKKP